MFASILFFVRKLRKTKTKTSMQCEVKLERNPLSIAKLPSVVKECHNPPIDGTICAGFLEFGITK